MLLWTALALLIALGLRAPFADTATVTEEPDTDAGVSDDAGGDETATDESKDESDDADADGAEASEQPNDDGDADESAEGDDGEDHATDETDDEPKAEDEDKTEDADAEKGPSLSSDLMLEARAMGFTAEEIAQFESDDDLQRALNFHARKYLGGQRPTAKPDDAKPQDDKTKPKAQTDESGQQDKPQAQGVRPAPLENRTFSKFELKLNPESVDPEIIDTLTQFNDDIDAKIENLAAAAIELALKSRIRDDFSEFDEFDQFVDGLGEEWAGVLGKGPRYGLDPASEHTANRLKVITQARQLAGLYGGRVPRKQLFKRALASEFMDKVKQVARKEISTKVGTREKQRTHRPTSRQPAPPAPGKKAATTFVKQFIADRE